MDKVKADKLREVTDGHDGTWIAHPGLLKIARQACFTIPRQWLVATREPHLCPAFTPRTSMHAPCPTGALFLPGRLPQVFDDNMPGPNQLSKLRQDVEVTADDLLRVPEARPASRYCSVTSPSFACNVILTRLDGALPSRQHSLPAHFRLIMVKALVTID